MAQVRPAVRMHSYLVEVGDLHLGASRMGGAPDLPPDMPWPEIGGRPIEFMTQIDLAEAARAFPLPGMPTVGWLVIFCDFARLYERSSLDEDYWRILYFEAERSALCRTQHPGEPADWFNLCELRLEREDCVPDLTAIEDDLVHDEWTVRNELNERVNSAEDHYPVHRLGGYPMLIQTFPNQYKGWEFLLQIDSDEEPGWMWGDQGRLYFWIRPKDLKRRLFEKSRSADEFY